MKFFITIDVLLILYAIVLQETQEALTGTDSDGEEFDIYKKPGETNEQYYERILVKNYFESSVKLEVRVECLKVLLPDLPIWLNDKYLQYVTTDYTYKNIPTYKSQYLDDIQKHWGENDDAYYKRIFKKYDDERIDQYMERIGIMKSLISTLPVWENNNFINYTRPYLQAYKQKTQKSNTESNNDASVPSSPSTSDSFSSSNPPKSSSPFTTSSSSPPSNPSTPSSPSAPSSPSTPSSPSIATSPSTSISSSASAVSETSPSNGNDGNENSPEEASEESSEEDKVAKGKEDYRKRNGEKDKHYCKRLFGGKNKLHKKKFKKAVKKLQKKLDSSDLKKVKAMCKKLLVKE